MSTDVKESLSGSKLLELLQSDIPLSEEELTHIIRALNHELSNSPSRQLARARMSLLETLRAVKQKKYQEAAVRSQLISILQQVEHQKAVSEARKVRRVPKLIVRDRKEITDFSNVSVFDLLTDSSGLREVAESGRYALIDGKLVFLTPDAVTVTDGHLALLPYPPSILAKYIATYRETTIERVRPGTGHFMENAAPDLRTRKETKKAPADTEDATLLTMDLFLQMIGGDHTPPPTFQEAMQQFMADAHVTEEELAERTGISVRTIGRMRNEENYRPTLPNIIAVCVGMHLGFFDGQHLVALAGYRLTSSERDRAYMFFLALAYHENVSNCNRYLVSKGLTPLTKRIFDHNFTPEEIRREEQAIAYSKRGGPQ